MAPTALARFREVIRSPTTQFKDSLWFGWSMALGSTLAFSIAPAVTKGAITGGMNPTTLLAVRLVISTLLLGGSIMLVTPGKLAVDRRGLLICGIAGLSNGVGMLAFFWALTRLEASITSMLFSLSPLAVLVLLALRGERFSYRHVVRLGLGLGGVYLLIGPGSSSAGGPDWVGIGLVLITIITFAIHLALIQWFLQGYQAQTVTFYVVGTMTVVAVGFWLTQGAEWHNPGLSGWLAIGILAVVSTYLARLWLFAAVRSLGSGQMALLLPLETFLAVLWSMLFLDERLAIWQWLGGLLILLSAVLAIHRLRLSRWRPRWRVWARV